MCHSAARLTAVLVLVVCLGHVSAISPSVTLAGSVVRDLEALAQGNAELSDVLTAAKKLQEQVAKDESARTEFLPVYGAVMEFTFQTSLEAGLCVWGATKPARDVVTGVLSAAFDAASDVFAKVSAKASSLYSEHLEQHAAPHVAQASALYEDAVKLGLAKYEETLQTLVAKIFPEEETPTEDMIVSVAAGLLTVIGLASCVLVWLLNKIIFAPLLRVLCCCCCYRSRKKSRRARSAQSAVAKAKKDKGGKQAGAGAGAGPQEQPKKQRKQKQKQKQKQQRKEREEEDGGLDNLAAMAQFANKRKKGGRR